MADKVKTKWVTVVEVTDPDTGNPVEVEIRKEEHGGMVGIDASYLYGDIGDVYSPFGNGILDIPDNEES